jgi:3-carboxy-cis,cis-muconate cycloisomerase
VTDLFWPGDERAGALMSEVSFLETMVRVEGAWLNALVSSGLAPAAAHADPATVVTSDDVDHIARAAEAGGNPVMPLVQVLRSRLDPDAARWLHRGLTSQDVLDTALVLMTRDVLDRLADELRSQILAVSILAEHHAESPMVGRTLTQHATPTTFGAVAAAWLDGIVDAAEVAAAARRSLPAQLGGAVGTLASTVELAALRGRPSPTAVARDVAMRASEALGLRDHRPWHTSRGPLTRASTALVSCADAWGRVATDVATLSRTEISELAEPSGDGRGGSSTMPHKQNPALSVLIRRAALAAPALGSTMHLAAAMAGDQRPDGAWHVEWATLRTLGRHTVVAASQTTELLQGLRVDTARMTATLVSSAHDMLAERRGVAELLEASPDPDPTTYLGITGDLVAGAVERGRIFLEENA